MCTRICIKQRGKLFFSCQKIYGSDADIGKSQSEDWAILLRAAKTGILSPTRVNRGPWSETRASRSFFHGPRPTTSVEDTSRFPLDGVTYNVDSETRSPSAWRAADYKMVFAD